MSTHERDAVSLMGGLLLLLAALAFLVGDLTDLSLDGRWVVPAALIAVGAAGLVSARRSDSDR